MEGKTIERKFLGKKEFEFDVENLLEIQLKSYRDFLQPDVPPEKRENKGLEAVFRENFPIDDGDNGEYILEYEGYNIGIPKYSIKECKDRGLTYGAPLKIKFSLLKYKTNKKTGERKFAEKITNEVYLGDIPLMTESGSFIINGNERVIVSQLHRSAGIFFSEDIQNGRRVISARIIPYRGSWIEFYIDSTGIYINLGKNKKIPVTILLRPLGYSTNEELMELFLNKKTININDDKPIDIIGKVLAEEVIDSRTDEVIAEKYEVITETLLEDLKEKGIEEIEVWDINPRESTNLVYKTIVGDKCNDYLDALKTIYNLIRTGELPSENAAREMMNRIFFSERTYYLGEIGRYRLNMKLYGNPEGLEGKKIDSNVLTVDDIVEIVKKLMYYYDNDEELDDIDHLANRRVRPVGELLELRFADALNRLVRQIREKLKTTKDITNVNDLVNARSVYTVIMSFFQTSQLSQFMDQTNPLAELTNKRRLSSLGPGGLDRERAGFEVRDVHYTHYGRICPVETPEGPNIGLIVSLANYARLNEYGFLITPYRKVVDGKITDEIVYLTADEEEEYIIAPADINVDDEGNIIDSNIIARQKGEIILVSAKDVQLMDVSTNQLVGVSASLIPFLEHDDANRALMGSNMQRQAVPLLRPEAPIVGTGREKKPSIDIKAVVTAKRGGKVVYVDAEKIIIKPDDSNDNILDLFEEDIYVLRKFERSNQNTTINQRPLVREGDIVKAGDVIADGMATDRGELALGRNMFIAFMSWQGFNFEDAIIVSERILHDDVLTSIHIEEYEVEVRDTNRGPEEITREIPNYSEELVKNLDENGIIRIGARVKPGDILVGKITPKGETQLSPEEKLLKAIFGEKASDVKDTSLRVDPGVKGIVIDTKILSRKKETKSARQQEKEKINKIKEEYESKIRRVLEKTIEALIKLMEGKLSKNIVDSYTKRPLIKEGTKLTKDVIESIPFDRIDISEELVDDKDTNVKIREVIETSKKLIQELETRLNIEIEKEMRGDELRADVIQLVKVYIATKKKLAVGDKLAGRHGNKGVVSKIASIADMPFMDDGTPIDVLLNPLGIPSRMNIGQLLETHLGWAAYKQGYYVKVPVFNGPSIETIKEELKKAGLPEDGKVRLRDGRTGEYFDNKVTVGIMYIMKLNHLVTDKIHARSIGPYSLITQQPLGGKSQFGGQRFGEMEVWALEAYGAAYTLQELLTVKSDDVVGRTKVYEAIVKGQNLPKFGIPESFKVLISEIRAIGINIYAE